MRTKTILLYARDFHSKNGTIELAGEVLAYQDIFNEKPTMLYEGKIVSGAFKNKESLDPRIGPVSYDYANPRLQFEIPLSLFSKLSTEERRKIKVV